MVGFCGVFGSPEHPVKEMSQLLYYNDDDKGCKYKDGYLDIEVVMLQKAYEKQPFFIDEDILIWLWGDVYGIKENDKYIPKKKDLSLSEYITKLYNKHGLNMFNTLNGEFAAVVYNQKNRKISLVSDRLSTHPIFYTITGNGNLVFSTQIQCLPLYPSVENTFEKKYLYQFFLFERVLGVKTPLRNIEQVHPGSILSYDLDSGNLKRKIYWTPRYSPKDRPLSEAIDDFIYRFKNVIRERINEDFTYGLYLSGGSDSRLILATIKDVYPDLDVKCYHMNEFMNREARIAKEVADACDCEFVLLEREPDYQFKVLEYSSPISIYNSWFDQAHGIGFKDRLRSEVDVLLNGSCANTILEMGLVPKKSYKLPMTNHRIYLPAFLDIEDMKEFIDLYVEGYSPLSRNPVNIPNYLNKVDREEIVELISSEYFELNNRGFTFHGVKYPSLSDFIHSYKYYPITNMYSYLTYYADNQFILTEYPFIDNRIIDFSLNLIGSYPKKKKVIPGAIKKINPYLVNIKHANTGIPLKYPREFHFAKTKIYSTLTKLFPHLKEEESWGNISKVLRKNDYVKKKLLENENLIKSCDYIDWNLVMKCYEDHINGNDNKAQLIGLLTFLENPTTKKILGENNPRIN